MRFPRYWLTLYGFVLSQSALVSMFLYFSELVSYPVRPFPNCLNMSLYFNAFIYPGLNWLYLIHRKNKEFAIFWATGLSFLFAFFAITFFEPLQLIDWKADPAYLVLVGLLSILSTEVFLVFYERKAGALR